MKTFSCFPYTENMKLLLPQIVLILSLCLGWSYQKAETCTDSKCSIADNCRCSERNAPIDDLPQLITLSFDEAVADLIYTNYWKQILSERLNPDGNPITATFYVPHEYSDYGRVHDLYVQGFEIAVNSITKNASLDYWRKASKETLVDEFQGQKIILNTFGKIPLEDIKGVRTPLLALQGDVSIEAYTESELEYDNSWPTPTSDHLFPYTLDYLTSQRCDPGNICPTESHPGFWMAPITDINNDNNNECNTLSGCNYDGTANEISDWLLREVEKFRSKTKAPMTILINSAFFVTSSEGLQGITKFLDTLATFPDVFLVSQGEVIEWMKHPVPLSEFTTVVHNRTSECNNAINCELTNPSGETRYMKSCVPCPEFYPWLGDPLGTHGGK